MNWHYLVKNFQMQTSISKTTRWFQIERTLTLFVFDIFLIFKSLCAYQISMVFNGKSGGTVVTITRSRLNENIFKASRRRKGGGQPWVSRLWGERDRSGHWTTADSDRRGGGLCEWSSGPGEKERKKERKRERDRYLLEKWLNGVQWGLWSIFILSRETKDFPFAFKF